MNIVEWVYVFGDLDEVWLCGVFEVVVLVFDMVGIGMFVYVLCVMLDGLCV